MIEKFATNRIVAPSEFLYLNRTSKALIPVSLLIPKFAHRQPADAGELRNRDTEMLRAVD